MTRSVSLFLAAMAVGVLGSAAIAQTRPAVGPAVVPAVGPAVVPAGGMGMPVVNNGQLTELAAQIVIVHNVPGVAIAVVDKTGVRAIGAAGVRQAGRGERVEPEDVFHLGSCGKAMTATMIGRLADRGVLSLEDQIGTLLPGVQMDAGFAKVRVIDLLRHRGGIGGGEADMEQLPFLRAGAADATMSRKALAERLLGKTPGREVGRFEYSNSGYSIAGYIAEKVTGKRYEELMREEVFGPLGMTTAGFGAPLNQAGVGRGEAGVPAVGAGGGDDAALRAKGVDTGGGGGAPAGAGLHGIGPVRGAATQGGGGREKVWVPVGHRAGAVPVMAGPYADNPPGFAPAGTMYMSMRDWGRFVAVHLGGTAEGVDGEYLKPATMAALHAAPEGADGSDGNPRYACGWGLTETRGRATLTHAGSNTFWFCQVLALPGDGWAVIVATNQGGEAGEKACVEGTQEMMGMSK